MEGLQADERTKGGSNNRTNSTDLTIKDGFKGAHPSRVLPDFYMTSGAFEMGGQGQGRFDPL